MSNYRLIDSKNTKSLLSGDVVYDVVVPDEEKTYKTVDAFQANNQQIRFQDMAVNANLDSNMELEVDVTVTASGTYVVPTSFDAAAGKQRGNPPYIISPWTSAWDSFALNKAITKMTLGLGNGTDIVDDNRVQAFFDILPLKNTGGNYANAITTTLKTIPTMPDVTAGGKVQKVEYTVREPLVSKFLSNQFAKGDYIKSYQTNGSVSLTLNLDQNYLENYAFKLWDSLGNAGTSGESSTFTVQITAARLNYVTFTSLRPLQPKTDILYYEHEIANRTVPSVDISNANQTASINFTTQLLEDLPQYVLILPRLNTNAVTGTNDNSASATSRDVIKSLTTMEITKLTMKYGTQLDILGNMGSTENIHKLYEHTVENLGRPCGWLSVKDRSPNQIFTRNRKVLSGLSKAKC